MTAKRLNAVTLMAAPWRWEVIVLHGDSPEAFVKFAKDSIDATVECGRHSDGHCYVEYGKPVLVWVRSIGDIPVLVHELIHAVFGMLEARGLKHGRDSEEAFTYTLQDLLTRVMGAKRWTKV